MALDPGQDPGRAAGEACGLKPAAPVLAVAVDPAGDLVAGDAAHRLAGFAWSDPGDAGPKSLAAWTDRGPAQIVLLPGPPDRWDRRAAIVGRNGVPAAAEFILAGLAVARPDDVASRCARALLAAEATARAARQGVWAAPARRGDDGAALASADGRYVVVEGRPSAGFDRSGALVLQFGDPGAGGLMVTVPKRSLRRFEASGMTGRAMEGRPVRVRGFVVGRDRPRMEVVVPEALERLE